MGDLHNQIVNLRAEISGLRDNKRIDDADFSEIVKLRNFDELAPLKHRKSLISKEGGPVTLVDFGSDMNLMTVTAGARVPATMLIWDCNTSERTHLIEPTTNWVLCSKLERTEGKLAGCGGMNNAFLLFEIADNPLIDVPKANLEPHDSYVSAAEFLETGNVLTASGDREVRLWDIRKESVLRLFSGHTSDVVALAREPSNPNIFISGACDFTARLWDLRAGETGNRAHPVYTFDTKSRDVSGVAFFPEGSSFATALNNSEIHLYDIRASCKLLSLSHQEVRRQHSAEQVLFSSSGRLLFGRYEAGKALCFDITKAQDMNGGAGLNNPDGCLVQRFHNERNPKNGINIVHMSIQADGKVLAFGDEKDNEVVVRLFWPKEGRRRR